MSLRVMVVDDSAFMRRTIADLLQSDPEVEVAGSAVNGHDALRKLPEISPDVIVMDVDMPVMDGIAAMERIMAEYPLPTVVLSAETPDMTLRALEAGAFDFVPKPHAHPSVLDYAMRDDLLSKVRAASRAQSPVRMAVNGRPKAGLGDPDDVIVIGCSTGGPQALAHLFRTLPTGFRPAILIAPNLTGDIAASLAARLNAIGTMPTRFGAELKPGTVCVTLDSADTAMKEAAERYGKRVTGVILTGSGSDGARGMASIAAAGGRTLAASPETCMAPDMPEAAIRTGSVARVVPFEEVAYSMVGATE